MKAYDLCYFLIILNACFWLFSALDIWSGEEGQIMTGAEVGIEGANEITNPGLPLISGIAAPISLVAILIGVVVGGAAGLSFRLTTPQVVGILAFTMIFWGAFVGAMMILSNLYLPDALIVVFTRMHWFVFIAGVIQMASGMSFKVAE